MYPVNEFFQSIRKKIGQGNTQKSPDRHQQQTQSKHFSNTTTSTSSSMSTTTTTTDSQMIQLLQQTDAIVSTTHPMNIPPALVEHQQTIINRVRQQLLYDHTTNNDDNENHNINQYLDHPKELKSKWNHHKKFVQPYQRRPHDWGIVAVYTCPNSCCSLSFIKRQQQQQEDDDEHDPILGAYREEYVWVQPPIDI